MYHNGFIIRVRIEFIKTWQFNLNCFLHVNATLRLRRSSGRWLCEQNLSIINLQHDGIPRNAFAVYTLENIKCGPAKTIIDDINQGRFSRPRLASDDIDRP